LPALAYVDKKPFSLLRPSQIGVKKKRAAPFPVNDSESVFRYVDEALVSTQRVQAFSFQPTSAARRPKEQEYG
jgi:hypothetical protein